MNVQTTNARIAFFETYGSLIQGYCNGTNNESFVDFSLEMYHSHHHSANNYDSLFHCQNLLMPSVINLRKSSYYSGFGSLFDTKGNLIWTLAVRNDHVKYVKLCYLLGKPIDPRALVFISQKDFDTKATFNKPLRTAFRAQMKIWLMENEVPMIEMDFKEMLAGKVTIPEDVKSIRAIKEWETNTVTEFIESYRVENALDAAGVELSF